MIGTAPWVADSSPPAQEESLQGQTDDLPTECLVLVPTSRHGQCDTRCGQQQATGNDSNRGVGSCFGKLTFYLRRFGRGNFSFFNYFSP